MKLSSKSGSSILSQLTEVTAHISPAQRLGLMTVGLLIFAGLIGVFSVQIPWMEKRGWIEARYAKEQQRSDILLEIQRTQGRLRESERDLLLTGGAPALTSHVSDLASKWGIQIDSVTPQGEVSIGPYVSVQLEITATSSLENLVNFLRSLENHRPFLALDRLEIGQSETAAVRAGRGVQVGKKTFEPGELQTVKLRVSALTRQGAA